MNAASSRQDPALQWHGFPLISTGVKQGHAHTSQGMKSTQEHNSCRFPCDTSQPHTGQENSSPVKAVTVLGLLLCSPGFPGSFAWMWGESVHQQEGRVLSLGEVKLWHCWWMSFMFPPEKELQAVSYSELRDPFIFWLFLLLTPISSADITAAHGTWRHFLKCFFFTK